VGLLTEVRLARDRVPSFERYPFSLPSVRALKRLELHPAVTFFVGENGSGKSTLLEGIAVACGFNPEGGALHEVEFDTRPSHSELHRLLQVRLPDRLAMRGYFLRAESFYNVASAVERQDQEEWMKALPRRNRDRYGGRALHEQSHGEAFLALFEHRLHGGMLVLLDEPEAALSPLRQMTFLSLLHQHVKAGAQFIIASHSPIVLAYPNAWTYQFGENGIERVEYEETEHFRVYRDFLQAPARSLRILLSEDE